MVPEVPLHRFCSVDDPGAYLVDLQSDPNYKVYGYSSNVPKYKGVAGIYNQIYADFMFKKGLFNYTFVQKKTRGMITKDGSLNGCLGSLHNNESDIMTTTATFPFPTDRVYPLTVLGQHKIQLLSGYKVTKIYQAGNFFVDSLKSISVIVWFLLIYTAFVLMILLHLQNLIQKVRKQSQTRRHIVFDWENNKFIRIKRTKEVGITSGFWRIQEVFDGMIGQNFMENSSNLPLFLLLVLCFTSHLLYNLVVKTNLLTVMSPVTVDTYQDIIDRKELSMLMPKAYCIELE